MTDSASIERELRQQGHAVTVNRVLLLQILTDVSRPLSALELRWEMTERGRRANRATVYRELDFLVAKGWLREVQLGENWKRYELASRTHHHHLVCKRCDTVQDIPLENELHSIEQQIETRTDFRVASHALEFFGLCGNCR